MQGLSSEKPANSTYTSEAIELEKEARVYLGMCDRAISKQKFNPELIYNMFMMGAEKLLVSRLLHLGAMPVHHSLKSLCEAINMFETFPADIMQILISIENRKDICSISLPDEEEIDESIYPLLQQAGELLGHWQSIRSQ